jgi:hypothetical protein
MCLVQCWTHGWYLMNIFRISVEWTWKSEKGTLSTLVLVHVFTISHASRISIAPIAMTYQTTAVYRALCQNFSVSSHLILIIILPYYADKVKEHTQGHTPVVEPKIKPRSTWFKICDLHISKLQLIQRNGLVFFFFSKQKHNF